MPAAGVVLIVIVVLIVLALVFYLVSTILALRAIADGLDDVIAGVGEILQKSAPVNDVVTNINENLDAGVDLLEGLLVKKAGMDDALGLVEGLYPGAAAAGFRNFPESATTTRAARMLYPEGRQEHAENLPRSPVIGADAPVQYEPRDDIGAPRKRLPAR